MAQHAVYDHHESHEDMKMNFQIGMDEIDTLVEQINEQFVVVEKMLKIEPAVMEQVLRANLNYENDEV
jgi:hypothetical protein